MSSKTHDIGTTVSLRLALLILRRGGRLRLSLPLPVFILSKRRLFKEGLHFTAAGCNRRELGAIVGARLGQKYSNSCDVTMVCFFRVGESKGLTRSGGWLMTHPLQEQ